MNISKQERAALDAALFRQEIEANVDTKEELLKYLHLVMEFNKILNLTRITDIYEAITLHIEDSLTAYKEFSAHPGRFIDIGTGGGFPGVPLALISNKQGVLLDSVKKKADAVNKILHQMNKNKQVISVGKRSEEYALKQGESFDIAIARAVSSLPTVEEYGTPLIKKGGRIISMRGDEDSSQIEKGIKAADILGLELESERHFLLDDTYKRSIFVFRKVRESNISLPRRNGLAHKKPLPDKK